MAHISLLSNVRLTGFVVMLGHTSLSGLLINMTMSFLVMLGHVFLSGLLINMTMSFVVMLGHVFFFRATNQHDHVLRSNAWPCFPFQARGRLVPVVSLGRTLYSKQPSTNHVCFCSL